MILHTLHHSKNILENFFSDNYKDSKIQTIQMPSINIKRGYSIPELFQTILSQVEVDFFYTFFFVRGRRILAPQTYIHKNVQEYSLENMMSLISNARLRVYHLYKYTIDNKATQKIKHGFIKFIPLSNMDKNTLLSSLNDGLEKLLLPQSLIYADEVGGNIFPYRQLNLMHSQHK